MTLFSQAPKLDVCTEQSSDAVWPQDSRKSHCGWGCAPHFCCFSRNRNSAPRLRQLYFVFRELTHHVTFDEEQSAGARVVNTETSQNNSVYSPREQTPCLRRPKNTPRHLRDRPAVFSKQPTLYKKWASSSLVRPEADCRGALVCHFTDFRHTWPDVKKAWHRVVN